jgi:mycothiol synthase
MLAPTAPNETQTLTARDGRVYTVRKFRWDDLEAIVRLFNTSAEFDGREPDTVLEELELEWRSPTFDPEQHVDVVTTPEGEIIAASLIEISVPDSYKGYGGGEVHPQHRGQGIATALLRDEEARFLDAVGGQYPEPQPIYVYRWAQDVEAGAARLFAREGYEHVRTFYQMRVDLTDSLQPAILPDGYELRPFDRERDAYAVYQAQQTAFNDHWGHTSDTPYEEWAHYRFNGLGYDPDMWLIAWKDGQVAGSSLCRPYGPDVPEMAWVMTLSVLREHRKVGLGSALLQQSFYTFQQKGYTKAGLGVDAENRTNALAMYERAGMSVYKRFNSYRKVIRGDAALIRD